MKSRSRFVGSLLVALVAVSGLSGGCGQAHEKTAVGGGNAFEFRMDVSPQSGPVGTVFVYDIQIDILNQETTLEDLTVQLNIPNALRLVRLLGFAATLNGDPVAIRSEEEQSDHITYFFGPGDVDVDPSTFEFQCTGAEVAEDRIVFATLSASGTTAPTVSRSVDIVP